MVAQFVDRFGWGAYWGTPGRPWPTTDGIIPWRLFHTLYAELRHLVAGDRLSMSSAVIHGLTPAFGKKGDAEKALRQLEREAAPLVKGRNRGDD